MNYVEFREVAVRPKLHKMSGDRLYRFEREVATRVSWILCRRLPFLQATHITYISLVMLLIVGWLAVSLLQNNYLDIVSAFIGFVLLYLVTITDKIDGALARAKNHITQRGAYFDHAVHVAYPFVFYFLIASFFFLIRADIVTFALTLLAGLITHMLISQREWRLLLGEKVRIEREMLKDLIDISPPKTPRLHLVLRVFDYLTFMIYAWTLFFYVGLVMVSLWYPAQVYILYVAHIVLTLAVTSYKVFISYPRDRLYTKEEAEALMQK